MSSSQHVEFWAREYQRDTSLRAAHYTLEGTPSRGWEVRRDDQPYLTLGPGYRLLRTRLCGVCSTDLDRHHLPFPLPQVTGHEVVVEDDRGHRYVVEINATHASRAVDSDCPFCRQGLGIHCPDRLVIGIHGLPGGFGPWLLAPLQAVVALPDTIDNESAVLIEPFAAALKAVNSVDLRPGDTVAVLGPRRLGMLILAALAGHRKAARRDFRILALSRHQQLLRLAARFGADQGRLVEPDGSNLPAPIADVVIDATGSASGLELGARIAARELHVKSTHGQFAGGLERLTQMVVDEITLAPAPRDEAEAGEVVDELIRRSGRTPRVAWLSSQPVPQWLGSAARVERFPGAAQALASIERDTPGMQLPRADLAVVDSAAGIDAVVRPDPVHQRALVRPRGEIWLRRHPAPADGSGELIEAVARRGLRVSTSRCGSFRDAVAMLEQDPELRERLPELITHRFDAGQLQHALRVARSPEGIKVLVSHPDVQDPHSDHTTGEETGR